MKTTEWQKLQRDLPIRGGKGAWLDAHRRDVEAMAEKEGIRELAQLVGMSTATIQRWRSGALPAKKDGPAAVEAVYDAIYWRGQADAYRQALEMAVRR